MWIDDFLELMSGQTITLEAIDRAYALKDKNLPDKLYKFREMNDYAISNLISDSVWLCSADKYNDPYECATTWCVSDVLLETTRKDFDRIIKGTRLESQLSSEEIEAARTSSDPMRMIATALLAKEKEMSEERKRQAIDVIFKAAETVSAKNISRINESIQRGMKICSFSTRVDSVVMWGHYAKSHTGFAIEYDVTAWPPNTPQRRFLHPVIYRSELFDVTKYHLQAVSGTSFNNLFGVIAATHKSPDWAYENEWRLVLPMGESFEDQNYPMPKPTGLYLGSRIGPENKKRLLDIALSKRIPTYQMTLSTDEFKLVACEEISRSK